MDYETLKREIRSPALQAVLAHWHQARAGSPMPKWADLRPSRMARQLNIIWAYTFDPRTRQFVGRLAGNRITEGFGKNFRGARLEDLHAPAQLPQIYAHMLRVVETPAVYKSGGTLFRKGMMRGVGERIMLPLGSGLADGIIGISDYELVPDTDSGESIELQENDIVWVPLRPPPSDDHGRSPRRAA
jgi:hypothetical protein